MTHRTQSQEQGQRRQRRSGQTQTWTPRVTTRATRFAVVLALAVVVATAVLGGFGGTPAEAAYIAWQGWIPGYQEADWYLYCYYNNGGFLGGTDGGIIWGANSDGSLCLAGYVCAWEYVVCYVY